MPIHYTMTNGTNLEQFNLIRNPFFELTLENEKFKQLFIGRDDEARELITITSFYKSGTYQNTILVGESGVGKTTILNNLMIELENDDLQYIYFPYLQDLEDFMKVVAAKLGKSIDGKNTRDMRIAFIKMLEGMADKLIIVIDNFEDIEGILDENSLKDLVEILKRSKILFICAIIKGSYDSFLSKYSELSGIFNPIMVKPFDVEMSKRLITSRLENSRIEAEKSIYKPFTEGAIEFISIYSFFIPRKMMGFASKMLLRAVLDNKTDIDEKMVKEYILKNSGFAEYIDRVSKRQIVIIEEMIKNGGEGSIVFLSNNVGISSVAIAENIQKLMNLGFVEETASPGKKKNFKLTNRLKILVS